MGFLDFFRAFFLLSAGVAGLPLQRSTLHLAPGFALVQITPQSHMGESGFLPDCRGQPVKAVTAIPQASNNAGRRVFMEHRLRRRPSPSVRAFKENVQQSLAVRNGAEVPEKDSQQAKNSAETGCAGEADLLDFAYLIGGIGLGVQGESGRAAQETLGGTRTALPQLADFLSGLRHLPGALNLQLESYSLFGWR